MEVEPEFVDKEM